MRAASLSVAVAIAVAAQTTYALFANGTSANVDFPLIVVVFAALSRGPLVGLWTGVVAGLVQDLLSGGIVGVSGLAKSLVGFAIGWAGSQFMLSYFWHRVPVLVVATMLHSLCFVGVYMLIPAAGPMMMWSDVLMQGIANALVGVLIYGVIEHGPSMWERMRRGRRGMASPRWRMG